MRRWLGASIIVDHLQIAPQHMKHAVGQSAARLLPVRMTRALKRGAQLVAAAAALLIVGISSGALLAISNEAETPASVEPTTLAAPTHCEVRLKLRRAAAHHRGVVQYSAHALQTASGQRLVPPSADWLGRRLSAGLSVPLRC